MEKQVKKVLDKLTDSGFESYLVGGYVRDLLLGRKSYDVDICTKALPKEIHSIFNSSKSNYGSVNLKIDKYNIDITTFRKDVNYVSRRPSEVIYVDSLEEDLVRRDFTINAICMDKNDKIIDLLGGIEDLNNQTIKVIGDAKERLKEDPLRILRAIRFATVLDFNIDEKLYNEIKNNYMLVSTLSKNRIKGELDKILLSKNFQKGLNILKETKILDIINLSYDNVTYVEDLDGMWAQLKVEDIPFTNTQKSNIIKITEVVSLGKIDRNVLFKYGLYICTIASKILNINLKDVTKIYNKMPIKGKDDLDITSQEIAIYVDDNKEIGSTYNELIDLVLNGKLKNKNKDIKEYLIIKRK